MQVLSRANGDPILLTDPDVILKIRLEGFNVDDQFSQTCLDDLNLDGSCTGYGTCWHIDVGLDDSSRLS